MKYRKLGNSNLKVSCLGIGGNIFGKFCNQQETKEILDVAFEVGTNFIDVADVYSKGKAEEFVGRAISNNRKKWIIATKVGVRSGESFSGKGRKEYIFSSIEGSLKRLKTDYIDLYQMHNFDPITPVEETLEALTVLIKAGKILNAGISNYAVNNLRLTLQLTENSNYQIISSAQYLYNLFKRDIEGKIMWLCKKFGLGIIVYGALARGILAGKYHLKQKIPPGSRALGSESIKSDLAEEVISVTERLEQFAKHFNRTVNELAIAWILRKPEISTVLMGVRNTSQLFGNISALDFVLSDSELLEIDKIIGDLGCFKKFSLGAFRRIIWAEKLTQLIRIQKPCAITISAQEKKTTPEIIRLAKQFGKDFFDGDRKCGYGGYKYDGRWKSVVKRMKDYYKLPDNITILDIGCAKGFILYDFKELMPNGCLRSPVK